LKRQKQWALNIRDEWWTNKLITGDLENGGWPSRPTGVFSKSLNNDFSDYADKYAPSKHDKKGGNMSMGWFFKGLFGDIGLKMTGGLKYFFPPLNECRQMWEDKFGFDEWPKEETPGIDFQDQNELDKLRDKLNRKDNLKSHGDDL